MDILKSAAERGMHFIETLPDRSVAPQPDALAALDQLDIPLPEDGIPAEDIFYGETEGGDLGPLAAWGVDEFDRPEV